MATKKLQILDYTIKQAENAMSDFYGFTSKFTSK